MLEVQDLHKAFAGFVAVGGVSLTVENRQIASVIGPNGERVTMRSTAIESATRTRVRR